MASDIWLRTILIVRKETRCRHIGYSFRLATRVLLYAPSHRQDSTYHGLCYTSRGALAETRNSSMGPPHEGSIRQPIASWANALTTYEGNRLSAPMVLRLLPIPVGLLILPCTSQCRRSAPLLPPFFLSQTEEPANAGTCARDRGALQQLALNVHAKHSDLTWPDVTPMVQFTTK